VTRTSSRVMVVRALALSVLASCLAAIGCSSVPPGYRNVPPTELTLAQREAPDEQLLDVGVVITEPAELRERDLERLGTTEDVRESERHFIAYHLKSTMQRSSHWGAVRVTPTEDQDVDLRVATRFVRSNGEMLQLEVVARDATGRVWLERKYHHESIASDFTPSPPGDRDVYQDLYNAVANDLAEFKASLSPAELERIREVARLKFAGALAPEAFGGYLASGADDTLEVRRLPALDDPHLARIEKVRARENLFIDTLDQYYEGFYLGMWNPYRDWREFNGVEIRAMRDAKNEAFLRGVLGVLMIAGAIALGANVDDAALASGALVVVGSQVIIDGFNISEQAEIHADAVAELADSFGTEMRPTTLELEGRRYQLTGDVDEQFTSWRALLRRIYTEETGFEGPANAEEPGPEL
jgi:hypothetical protein